MFIIARWKEVNMGISGKLFVAIAGLSALSYVAGCHHGREYEKSLSNYPKTETLQLRMIRDKDPDLFIKTSQELDDVAPGKTASFVDSVYHNVFFKKLRETADSIASATKETVKNMK